MLLVDANVLLHAVNEAAPEHGRARRWLGDSLAGPDTVAFAWIALLAFVRLATHPSVFVRPLAIEQALRIVATWLDAPPAITLEPTSRHVGRLTDLLTAASAGGSLVNDAHLAALALEHGATVVSFDRDFDRFAGLRTLVP